MNREPHTAQRLRRDTTITPESPGAPSMDRLDAMIDECADMEDMRPYVWHRMDTLTEYMEDRGHDIQSFLSLMTGDFSIDDDWFQTDVCGHLISCTDAAHTLLISTDSSIIESIWMSWRRAGQ